MYSDLALYIDGAFLSGESRDGEPVLNPATGQPLGFVFAFANCAFFMLYVILGHRIAEDGGGAGIDRLGASMLIALVTITPIGFTGALPAMTQPLLILAGIGVGLCSSVIPYVCDQLAMARLPRATFALLLSLLPASATIIGIVVLGQIPKLVEIVGILLVAGGVALHQEAEAVSRKRAEQAIAPGKQCETTL